MARLDTYEKRPSGMNEYLSMYGWHFSKKMAEFASLHFCDGRELIDSQALNKISKNLDLVKNNIGFDANYLFARFQKLFPENSDYQLAKMIDDWLKNNYEESVFTNFYSDCIANGIAIIWEEMI